MPEDSDLLSKQPCNFEETLAQEANMPGLGGGFQLHRR